MPETNVDELKKLSPEERIWKLKALEEEKKKEIEEAEQMIKESVSEMKHEHEVEEEVEEEERLQKEKFDLDKKDDLEGLVEEEAKGAEKELSDELVKQQQYKIIQDLSQAPLQNLYQQVREVYQKVTDNGEMTPAQERMLRNLNYAMSEKQEAISSGQYAPSGNLEGMMDASKSMMDYIRR